VQFAGAKFRAAASPFVHPFVKARRGRYGPPQMKIHPLITSTDELAALVSRISTDDFVAVDTEFMRENSYWPDLS